MGDFDFINAKMTWTINPHNFYITLGSDEETRIIIKSGIQALIDQNKLTKPEVESHTCFPRSDDDESDLEDNIEESYKISNGDFVLAPCRYLDHSDGLLFRAQILDFYHNDILGGHFKLRFIDYGPEQWVHLDDIYETTEALYKPEPLAYKCMLEGLYPDSNIGHDWTEDAKAAFKELTSKQIKVSNQCSPSFDPHRYNYVSVFICPNQEDWVSIRDHLLLLGKFFLFKYLEGSILIEIWVRFWSI